MIHYTWMVCESTYVCDLDNTLLLWFLFLFFSIILLVFFLFLLSFFHILPVFCTLVQIQYDIYIPNLYVLNYSYKNLLSCLVSWRTQDNYSIGGFCLKLKLTDSPGIAGGFYWIHQKKQGLCPCFSVVSSILFWLVLLYISCCKKLIKKNLNFNEFMIYT